MANKKIHVQDLQVSVKTSHDQNDYISLTDIAKKKNAQFTRYVIQNWMRTKFTLEYLAIWEEIHNHNFNRVEFDAVRKKAGDNSFVMTPTTWIEKMQAIGIISKAGRYGGTYAHKDIAMEFASWISPEFKLYLIKEFQRLKEEEQRRLDQGWDIRRSLTKINYQIHTDAVKEHLIPTELDSRLTRNIYASEADVLNVALYGMTAQDWKARNPDRKSNENIRDRSNVYQLICLSNLEIMNAELIRQGIPQNKRLVMLNESAQYQMRSLLQNASVQNLEGKVLVEDSTKGDKK
jgi:hypothetical protein